MHSLKSFGSDIQRVPSAHTLSIIALMYNDNAKNIVLCGGLWDSDIKKALSIINNKYMPFTTTVVNDNSDKILSISSIMPAYKKLEDKVTVYICENRGCREPFTDIERLNEE